MGLGGALTGVVRAPDNDSTRSEVVSAEGINSQAPTEVQNMIMSLDVSCLTSNQIIKLFNNYVHVMH